MLRLKQCFALFKFGLKIFLFDNFYLLSEDSHLSYIHFLQYSISSNIACFREEIQLDLPILFKLNYKVQKFEL
jgi:hypothetical protein